MERKANNETQKSLSKVVINWYPGHMAKTKRLIKENLEFIDIVLEVVDSRIPFSSRIKDLDDIIKSKPKLMILTKKDLCDEEETKKWVKHYEKKCYKTILMDIEHEFNYNIILNSIKEIMKNINEKRESKGLLNKKPRILVIGVPNVGKSTLINHLVKAKVASTGNKPGVTKNLNWIRKSDDFELLDTPGLLWPKIDEGNIAYNLAAFTAIREEVLPLYDVVVYILKTLEKYYPQILLSRYNLKEINDELEALDVVGKRRGALERGGGIDYDKVINIIINDFKQGFIKGVTFDRYEK